MLSLGVFEPGSPEWQAERRWRIGGSEIAQVCGWSPYGTADDLMAAKINPAEREATGAQERGNALEDAVLAWAASREGLALEPAAVSKATYVHDNGWALFNPDAISTTGVLVETKTTADRSTERGWGRAGTASVPLHYAAQVQWGLGVLGYSSAVLACLHGATNGRPDLGLAVYRLKADPDAFAALLRKGAAFIARLESARKDIAA